MNIAMFSNTYAPIVGGVERSIDTFVEDFRHLGHNTLIFAPQFQGAEQSSDTVVRLPAIKNAYGPFSLRLPIDFILGPALREFAPDVIHCHQPFMLGDAALRQGHTLGIPVVFTYHTLYERYADSMGIDPILARRLALLLPTAFANLCDAVIAPTASIAELCRGRGIDRPIHVVPTGIDITRFHSGNRQTWRARLGAGDDDVVIGHLGRLVPSKNVEFLARAVAKTLAHSPRARFLLVGEGESRGAILAALDGAGVGDRVLAPGVLRGDALVDAYAAMDLFTFTSTTDTQGVVLIESLAAGIPVVALDYPGPRDIIRHDREGHLLPANATFEAFAEALTSLVEDDARRRRYGEQGEVRARDFTRESCAERLLAVYREAILTHRPPVGSLDAWEAALERLNTEWALLLEKAHTAFHALSDYVKESSDPATPR
ncbi:MAG: glycosyltransferase [Candidatus Competibacterales bacterium]